MRSQLEEKGDVIGILIIASPTISMKVLAFILSRLLDLYHLVSYALTITDSLVELGATTTIMHLCINKCIPSTTKQ